MSLKNRNRKKGFSLVELLAVVLVLAALAAIAIPLYTAQRQSAAGRTCKANLAAMAASLSAYALRTNTYPTTAGWTANYVAGTTDGSVGIVGSPEGLAALPTCPLTGTAYTYAIAAGVATITCPNQAAHITAIGGTTGDYAKTMPKIAADSLP